MTFELDDRWIWDFWIAHEGDKYHLFFLNAPRSLGDPHLRHRNATIGHAVSTDLIGWQDLGFVVGPGDLDSFDETATWTGSVIHDGREWRLYYTGSRFLHATEHINIETIGEATSVNLTDWVKKPGPILTADSRWYETLPDGTWHEEAWRDPWVFKDVDGWHMLLTARAHPDSSSESGGRDVGVVGHAFSADLNTWEAREPLSAAGSGFAHLEVLQTFAFGPRDFVVFSCDRTHLAGSRDSDKVGGIWVAPRDRESGWCAIDESRLLADESLYAGRIVTTRDGGLVLMAFENDQAHGFSGRLTNPIPLVAGPDGWPVVEEYTKGRQL